MKAAVKFFAVFVVVGAVLFLSISAVQPVVSMAQADEEMTPPVNTEVPITNSELPPDGSMQQ